MPEYRDVMTLAAKCLELPGDYGTDNEAEGKTWGRIGVSYHRDSGPKDITVAECIFDVLHGEFPDDVQWQSASHWGFGWTREILIRVKNDDGEITDAFIAAIEYGDGFDESEFRDEIDAAVKDKTLDNIWSVFPGSLHIPDHMDQAEVCAAIYTWLAESEIQIGGDDLTWYSREDVELAGLHLGFWDLAFTDEDEFFAAIEADGCALEFRWWCQAVKRRIREETQGVLFSD